MTTYTDFASQISFYEFLHSEFKPPSFDTSQYAQEIAAASSASSIEGLCDSLLHYPRTFDVFEEIFQLDHFTDAQYINFLFDVNTLNNSEVAIILRHLDNHVFNFENGEPNATFAAIYATVQDRLPETDKTKIFYAKRAIVSYTERLMNRASPKKRTPLYTHISKSIESRTRIARYLFDNLNAPAFLKSLHPKAYLEQKRHPVDPKGLRGKFGPYKITGTLRNAGFHDVSSLVGACPLPLAGLTGEVKNIEFAYAAEKFVEAVTIRKTRKPKQFDFVLLHRGVPRILIETNFYSTSGGGTKIGINEGEYTDLHADISSLNQQKGTNLTFMWITDGNYWLSSGGESRYRNLKTHYFTGPFDLLNYNLFKEVLPSVKSFLEA